ncbi:hypothetical protein EOD42_13865 [Rhodovarius crocodyli]|uniref:Uncharacterized protein n=1 Tax=Rhodovarius crocodyli TaxID=1979269 RepID=A0A437MEZ5_9PROT|nr:hypothetical protein [Rhodovarius crocodyli]RVT96199.1 hypothetical protein EOD42_13865 [Rhodovarius crocodyli]
MTFERADTWLLDRVFQPIATGLAGWASPLKIGRECLVAALGLSLTADFLVVSQGAFTTMRLAASLLQLVAIWYMASRASQVDQRLKEGAMNPLRADWVLFRYIDLVVVPLSALGLPNAIADKGAALALLNFIEAIAVMAGVYLASCQKTPPPLPLARAVGAGA